MRAKDAWQRVAECAALAEEANDAKSRSLFAKLRDSWVQIAHDCERIEGSDCARDPTASVNAKH